MDCGVLLPLCRMEVGQKNGCCRIDVPPCGDQGYSMFCIRLPGKALRKAKTPYLQIRHGGQCYDVMLAREVVYLMPQENGRRPVWAY